MANNKIQNATSKSSKSFWKKPIFWLAVCLGISIIIVIIMIVIMTKNNKSYINKVNQTITGQQDEQYKFFSNQLNDIRATGGIQGNSGPPGPVGPTGGAYQAAGTLENKKENNLVADRAVGPRVCNIAYMNIKNKTPSQRWIYGSNNTLKNQYNNGKCLTADGSTLYLSSCNTGNNQQFNWVSDTGQLQQINTTKCIDITNEKITNTSCFAASPNNLRDATTRMSTSTNSTPARLYLKECTPNKESQVWAFSS